MAVNKIIYKLMEVGLSEYEARAYVTLLGKNPVTAYELARISGISTSKIYGVLSRLSERGMVSVLEEQGKKRYAPMDAEEFIEGYRSRIDSTLKVLREELSSVTKTTALSCIWNIRDYAYLMDKAARMVQEAEETLLMSAWGEEAGHLRAPLEEASARGVRIASIHFGPPAAVPGRVFQHPIEDTIYAEKGGRGLVIVADSREVLMGTVSRNGNVEGAWSSNRGFVTMAEDYIKHDIYMMKIVRRFDGALKRTFGQRYVKLRDIFGDEDSGGNHEGIHRRQAL